MIGSQPVNKVIQLKERRTVRQEMTRAAVDLQEQKLKEEFKPAVSALVCQAMRYRDHMAISTSEPMTAVDAFDHNIRKGHKVFDLLVVSPAIDGRLKDAGKESSGE